MLRNAAIPGERNVIKKEDAKILKIKRPSNRNSISYCEFREI
jgi:hypothetical protein